MNTSNTSDKDLSVARTVAERAAAAGGRAYFVGGYVRDRLLGRGTKDIDVEVHGLTVAALAEIIDSVGTRITVGESFGIFGIKGCGIDIAMPRSETAVGRGHRDLEVSVDPYIGTYRAARRRDFTVNAMMEDVLTGEVTDHFGGERDLRAGVLRHVCDETFPEDPLRILRGAQFAARFGFTVAPETIELSSRADLSALSHERVMGETEKALLLAERPSVYFEILRREGQLSPWYAELEGSSFAVPDEAAKCRSESSYPLGFMLASLCAPLDESAAHSLVHRLTSETRLVRYVLCEAALMRSSADDVMTYLDSSVSPEDTVLLARTCRRADASVLAEALPEYRRRMSVPAITGGELISLGLCEGPSLGDAVRYAHGLLLAGEGRETAISAVLAKFKKN